MNLHRDTTGNQAHNLPDLGLTALRALRMIIAGGGTGGHLFPGIAIAEEFMTRDPQNSVLFISTGNALEKSVLSQTGFTLKAITAEGIKGRGIIKQVRSILKIPRGIFESVRELKRYRPDLVLGVGSYSAGPVVMGGWLMGIKIALHEQNMLPGITNRLLSRFADRIFISFKNTGARFNFKKVCVTGNPVRQEILRRVGDQRPVAKDDSPQPRRFRVLVLGGSQGAHAVNLVVMEALLFLKESARYFFIHQAGDQDEAMVNSAYRRHGIDCEVGIFFNDMAAQYQQADLIICRSGATTVAEITAVGKGAIFIPFPFAADNHQELNARALSDRGAAETILQKDLNAEGLAQRIAYYAARPEALARMASRARNLGRPEAARKIVDGCYRLVLSQ